MYGVVLHVSGQVSDVPLLRLHGDLVLLQILAEFQHLTEQAVATTVGFDGDFVGGITGGLADFVCGFEGSSLLVERNVRV